MMAEIEDLIRDSTEYLLRLHELSKKIERETSSMNQPRINSTVDQYFSLNDFNGKNNLDIERIDYGRHEEALWQHCRLKDLMIGLNPHHEERECLYLEEVLIDHFNIKSASHR